MTETLMAKTPMRTAEIAGAGLAGLTAAAALCQRGWRVRVHERTAEMRIVGSGLSIFENALRVMRAIGAEADAVRGAREGAERETRDAEGRTTSRARYATRMFEITRQQVIAALADCARRSGAEIVTGSTVAGATPDGRLRLEDGQSLTADLVIGADGVHSQVREALGIRTRHRWLADGAIRIVIPRTEEEASSADGRMNIEYWAGTRRMLVAACSRSELYVALTALDSDTAAKAIPIDKDLWKRSFPCLKGLIDRLDGEARWDRFQVIRVDRWSAGKAALLGDAAHAMAPNLGQGGACAMMNALGLAVALDETADVERALDLWERRERPLTDHTQRLSTFYSALTTWPDGLRDLVFGAVSRFGFMRRQYLRTALHIPTGTEAFAPEPG
jgi:2-polyprenyl-6-methoxyphenol hydroxylase-like FAD-dependent oxidoreductase